jgi:hypothetical protein
MDHHARPGPEAKVIGRYPTITLSDARLEAKRLLVAPDEALAPASSLFAEPRDEFLQKRKNAMRSSLGEAPQFVAEKIPPTKSRTSSTPNETQI